MQQDQPVTDWLEAEPVASQGTWKDGSVDLAWSEDGIRFVAEGVEQRLLPDAVRSIQVSRWRALAPPQGWRRRLGLAPRRVDTMNFVVADEDGVRLRLCTRGTAAEFDGLPWYDVPAPMVPSRVALPLLNTARALGGEVAGWLPEDASRQPEMGHTEEPNPFPLTVLKVAAAMVLIPMLLAPMDFMRISGWLPGMALIAVGAGVHWLFRVSRLELFWMGARRYVTYHRPAGIFARTFTVGDGAVTPGATPAEILRVHSLAPDRTRMLRGRTNRFVLLFVSFYLLGGWLSTLPKGEHEVARLGGWFTGDGGSIPFVTGALTEDYSLVGNPVRVHQVAISPDGQWVASVTSESVSIWDVDAERVVVELHGERLGTGHQTWIGFSRDGRQLFHHFRQFGDSDLEAWDTDSWQQGVSEPWELGEAMAHCAPADGGLLVAELRGDLVVLEAAPGRSLRGSWALTGVSGHANSIAFSPGCQALWIASGPTFTSIGIGTGEVRSIGLGDGFVDGPMVFAGNDAGDRVAVIVGDAAYVVESGSDPRELRRWRSSPWSEPIVAYTSTGALLVALGEPAVFNASRGVVYVFSGDGEPVAEFAGHMDSIRSMSASADGTWVVTGSRDQTARVWRVP